MKTLKLKEGQTYICTKSIKTWWTEGKDYTVFSDHCGELYILDEEGDKWFSNSFTFYYNKFEFEFKLKDPTIDLKAEITYWKETAKFWKANANYWKETSKFWKETH